MSPRRRGAFLLWLLLALAASAPAYAQKHDDREASARELFALGKYDEALALYGKLYAEAPHPTYLRNIGRCYQNLGEPDKAIASFREYLRQVKNLAPDQRTLVEGYIREMQDVKQKREEAGAPAAAHRAPEATAAPPPPAAAPSAEPPPATSIASPAAGGGDAAPGHDGASGSRRTASYLIGGAGVVALAVGSFFGIQAITHERSSETDCPGTSCGGEGLSLNQQAKTDARIADFTMGAGLVGVGVAAYLFVTSRAPASKSSESATAGLHLAPELGPHQAGLLAGVSW